MPLWVGVGTDEVVEVVLVVLEVDRVVGVPAYRVQLFLQRQSPAS